MFATDPLAGSGANLPLPERLCKLRRSFQHQPQPCARMSQKKTRVQDFEQSMRELEALVERLEQGDLPLEEALKQFERGVALTRACQTALKAAEQKVEILMKASNTPSEDDRDEPVIEEFEPES